MNLDFCEIRRNALKTFLFLFCLFLSACSSTQVAEREIPSHYSEIMRIRSVLVYGGGGTSPYDAIIIKGAENSFYGVDAERRYLEKKFPDGFVVSEQKLMKGNGRIFDCWIIFVSGGEKKEVFFEISDFLGR